VRADLQAPAAVRARGTKEAAGAAMTNAMGR